MFREICFNNYIWNLCYENTFSELYKDIKKKKNIYEMKNIDWKSEVNKNFLLLQAFKEIILAMNQNKEKGNDLFKKQDFEEALKFYQTAIGLAK